MRWTLFSLLFISGLGAALAGDFCTDSLGNEIYCSGYCCGDDCCYYYYDDGLSVGYIVLIVVLVLVKIGLWTCFCFYRRRRIANGVVIRQNVQPQCVVSSVSSSYNYGYDQRGPQQPGVPPPYSPSPNTSQVPMKSHA